MTHSYSVQISKTFMKGKELSRWLDSVCGPDNWLPDATSVGTGWKGLYIRDEESMAKLKLFAYDHLRKMQVNDFGFNYYNKKREERRAQNAAVLRL